MNFQHTALAFAAVALVAGAALFKQDDTGQVWAVSTDFAWIAKRHGIAHRDAQFEMASRVVGSVTSTPKPGL